jgi:hypothetical protein
MDLTPKIVVDVFAKFFSYMRVEDCWPILFNKYTGFEILQHGSDCEQFVIPFIYHHGKRDAEKSAGREHSYVIARKISDSGLEWPVPLKSLINNDYPLNDDGQNF